jgi:hypothetical protein
MTLIAGKILEIDGIRVNETPLRWLSEIAATLDTQIQTTIKNGSLRELSWDLGCLK